LASWSSAKIASAIEKPKARDFTGSPSRHAELVSASIRETRERAEKWTLKQVQGDA
jgi:hypothetical protein